MASSKLLALALLLLVVVSLTTFAVADDDDDDRRPERERKRDGTGNQDRDRDPRPRRLLRWQVWRVQGTGLAEVGTVTEVGLVTAMGVVRGGREGGGEDEGTATMMVMIRLELRWTGWCDSSCLAGS
ncbi:hypothetical protein CLOP_g14255 [Closterium sp. NIES-67]|nr:hypothetical protein CLOP_g14255 [Closterium sp. NIES-67]